MSYRKNVAAIILNSEGKILAAERTDIPGAWQIPQGGIDSNETAQEALFRELKEEIGVSSVEILAQIPFPLRYDFPAAAQKKFGGKYQGQEQTYFLVRLSDATHIDLNSHHEIEFAQVAWLTTEEFRHRIQGFKRDTYLKALSYFEENFAQYFKGAAS